jgi:hypothetical protein
MTAWLLLNGGTIATAIALALAAGATTRTTPLGLATLSGYLVLVHSVVLGAGVLGYLGAAVVGCLVAGALVAALALARRAPRAVEEPDGRGLGGTGARFAVLAAALALLVWVWPHLTQATRLWIWDDYTYHLVYPALWLGEHAITAPAAAHTFTMQAWYPLSASVVATWFMLPWPDSRADALAWVSLTGPLYASLIATGAAAALARAGCRPGAWAVPLVLLATSPRIGVMASSFSDADLAQAAALLGGFAFAVPRGAEESRRELNVDAAYAGLLSGLALGVKISAAPLALVVLAMLLLRGRARPGPPARAVGIVVAIVAAAWVVTGGYWYARNVIHTGNPVYPAAFLVWPGTTFPETTLLEYTRQYGARRALTDALVVYADWPRSHAVLAVIGLVVLAGWLALQRRSATRAQRYYAGGTLALALTLLGLLPFAPYSAGNDMTFRSGFVHWDSMRYVALVPILGWIALGFLLNARVQAGTLVVAVIAAAALLSAGVAPLAVVALALAATLLSRVGDRVTRWPAPTTRARVAAVGGIALAIVTIVVSRHGAKAAATAAAFQREPLFGAVVAVLDRQPPGTRVTVFGDQWIYPAFGAQHHLRPVRLDQDGRTLPSNRIGGSMGPGDLTVDPATFRANLRAAGVDVVVVVHLPHPGRSAQWPAHHAALEATADAQLLHRDGSTAVWRLLR